MQIQIIIEIKTRMFFYDVLTSAEWMARFLRRQRLGQCNNYTVQDMVSIPCPRWPLEHTLSFPQNEAGCSSPVPCTQQAWAAGAIESCTSKARPSWEEMGTPCNARRRQRFAWTVEAWGKNKVCVGWKQMWSRLRVSRTNYHPILSAGGILHVHPPEAGNSR